ncbi:MAG TPA: hypothetical protein VHO29_16920 [Marmoricola sp.]|nr:hypothetical protein [Marmoricola sp.]
MHTNNSTSARHTLGVLLTGLALVLTGILATPSGAGAEPVAPNQCGLTTPGSPACIPVTVTISGGRQWGTWMSVIGLGQTPVFIHAADPAGQPVPNLAVYVCMARGSQACGYDNATVETTDALGNIATSVTSGFEPIVVGVEQYSNPTYTVPPVLRTFSTKQVLTAKVFRVHRRAGIKVSTNPGGPGREVVLVKWFKNWEGVTAWWVVRTGKTGPDGVVRFKKVGKGSFKAWIRWEGRMIDPLASKSPVVRVKTR